MSPINWQFAIKNRQCSNIPCSGVTAMTKRLPLVIVLILFLTSLAYAQDATPSPSPAPKPAMSRAQSQRAIIATEKKLWEAWKNKDFKPFRANLSADSITISDMGVANKTEAIKAMEGTPCEVKSYE